MKGPQKEDLIELDSEFQKVAKTKFEYGRILECGKGYYILQMLDKPEGKNKVFSIDSLRGNTIEIRQFIYY